MQKKDLVTVQKLSCVKARVNVGMETMLLWPVTWWSVGRRLGWCCILRVATRADNEKPKRVYAMNHGRCTTLGAKWGRLYRVKARCGRDRVPEFYAQCLFRMCGGSDCLRKVRNCGIILSFWTYLGHAGFCTRTMNFMFNHGVKRWERTMHMIDTSRCIEQMSLESALSTKLWQR